MQGRRTSSCRTSRHAFADAELTTDGHKPYLSAVEDAFGADIDYAVPQKIYGAEPGSETR